MAFEPRLVSAASHDWPTVLLSANYPHPCNCPPPLQNLSSKLLRLPGEQPRKPCSACYNLLVCNLSKEEASSG